MDLNWMLEEYDGIVYISDIENYELMYINKIGCEQLGFKLDDAIGKPCYEVLQGRTDPCPFCTNQYLTEEGFYEWEYYNPVLKQTLLLKDRKLVWEGRATRIEYAIDISKYSRQLKQKDLERETVLKCIPGGFARVDARDCHTILWYGADFLNMLGYTAEQFEDELNSQCGYVYPEDLEVILKEMEKLKQEKDRPAIFEMRAIRRDGTIRTLMTTLNYDDGQLSEDGIPSFYSAGIDITEIRAEQDAARRALEEAYQAAKMANSAKTDFLSRMSHDIRTPMNAVLGMATIATANSDNEAKVLDCQQKIIASSKHLLSLINEILDMSKAESGHLELTEENFDLADLVENVLNMCGPQILERQHTIKVNIGSLLHDQVIGDIERLQQVMLNILSNAIKYTPNGGNITLTIKETLLNVNKVSRFEFIFEDNGIGMSQDYLKQIFEPFTRAEDSRTNKTQGTGLGMTISENIVHMMNGTINVESTLGQGSRFTVDIPLALQDKKEQAPENLTGKQILVIDDELDVCESATLMLNSMGLIASWAQNGKEGLAEMLRAKAANKEYFAVLLDWKMPQHGGLEVSRAIREQVGKEVPIIIVSAYDFSEVEGHLIDVGVNGFITKPLFKSKLLHMLQKFTQIGSENPIPQQDSQPTTFKGQRVLLAEDNDLNREIATELLQMLGLNVETSENGKDVVAKFMASNLNHYDAILMDIQMPLMNGYDATKAIRNSGRADAKLPILALTANAFTEDIKNAKRAGMNNHIAKPIDIKKMAQTLAEYLEFQ